MSLQALGRLQTAHENLICALDANDVEAIEQRLEQMRSAIEAVRSAGGWRDCPQLKERARLIAKLAEAARIRVNFLTDLTAQRLQMLADARGETVGGAYSRPLRLIA
jgi:acyl-CoA reductase-like NAD-dependent aldehyde dehydrogenase